MSFRGEQSLEYSKGLSESRRNDLVEAIAGALLKEVEIRKTKWVEDQVRAKDKEIQAEADAIFDRIQRGASQRDDEFTRSALKLVTGLKL
ncbi:MAG: hypothetical protein HYX22_02785 [Candidatus Yanofskybacteria bacterium]|nr:hypothetical protein [Candidatus Yanofskybacteria bacterium]